MTFRLRRREPVPSPRSNPETIRAEQLTLAARIAVVVGGLSGASGIAGWMFDVDGLRRVIPHEPYLRFNTALCLALFALAWFLPRAWRIGGAAVVGVLALTTVGEYVLSIDRAGIDQLIFTDPAHTAHPGRMAVVTSLSFLLLAIGRIVADLGRLREARWCAFVVVLLSALTLLGHAYDASWLHHLRPISTSSVVSATSLLLFGAAMLATRPSPQLMWSLESDDAGAILIRRLLPVALVGPPVVGALALVGQRADLYEGATTAAIIVVACAFVVAVVTWAAAQRLSRIDRGRIVAIAELTDLKTDLEGEVDRRATQLQRRHNEIAVLEDRQRIAADLHDIVIQRLFAAGMFLQGGAALASDAETRHRLETAVEAMDAAIKDLRASIFELGGRLTMPTDMTTAVDDVCVESARMLGFMPDLTVDDPNSDADRVRDDVLAVLREALANVARHARASKVTVVLRSRDGVVSLSVSDDGVGMTGSGRSSGTRNMVERARAHGGECSWSGVAPHGTRVHWRLPVKASVNL